MKSKHPQQTYWQVVSNTEFGIGNKNAKNPSGTWQPHTIKTFTLCAHHSWHSLLP